MATHSGVFAWKSHGQRSPETAGHTHSGALEARQRLLHTVRADGWRTWPQDVRCAEIHAPQADRDPTGLSSPPASAFSPGKWAQEPLLTLAPMAADGPVRVAGTLTPLSLKEVGGLSQAATWRMCPARAASAAPLQTG